MRQAAHSGTASLTSGGSTLTQVVNSHAVSSVPILPGAPWTIGFPIVLALLLAGIRMRRAR